jgi:hypothetical protein
MKKQPASNVKITPKVDVNETGATRQFLGLDTKEVKTRIELQMESNDPKQEGKQVSTIMNDDAWYAASVPGYDEIKQFYMKMAKEMDWFPGEAMKGMGMATGGANMQVGMTELRKNAAKMNGIPMFQTISMTIAGQGMEAQGAGGQQQAPPPQPQAQPQQEDQPTSAKEAIAQGIAGKFGLGGFGKKKKQEPPPPPPPSNTQPQQNNPPAAAGTPGALMEMQVEVTSYSNSALDKSLFDVPAGYAQAPKVEKTCEAEAK